MTRIIFKSRLFSKIFESYASDRQSVKRDGESIWTRTLFGLMCRTLLALLHVWPAFAINSWLPQDVTSDTTPDVSESPSSFSFSFSSEVTWRRGRLENGADRLSLRKEVDRASKLNSGLGYPDAVRWQHVLAPHIGWGINDLLYRSTT